jgi:hypothetical protein
MRSRVWVHEGGVYKDTDDRDLIHAQVSSAKCVNK